MPLFPTRFFAFAHQLFLRIDKLKKSTEERGGMQNKKYHVLPPFCFTVSLGFGFNEKGDGRYCQ